MPHNAAFHFLCGNQYILQGFLYFRYFPFPSEKTRHMQDYFQGNWIEDSRRARWDKAPATFYRNGFAFHNKYH